MSRITPAYQCYSCNEWLDDEDDASECCHPIIIDSFKCTQCGEYHMQRQDAETCCNDATTCPFCQAEHILDGSEPAECCGVSLYAPTPAELEAAGQQRLAL